MISECTHCDGEETHKNHSVCPRCEEAGFDGQGHVRLNGSLFYQKQCWDCGQVFAVEIDEEESE